MLLLLLGIKEKNVEPIKTRALAYPHQREVKCVLFIIIQHKRKSEKKQKEEGRPKKEEKKMRETLLCRHRHRIDEFYLGIGLG